MNRMNSGYSGYSMSNRAVEAYENREKPLSKWTKKDIISVIEELDQSKAELFKKLTINVLKEKVLIYSSWHHTSDKFNKTDFYSINEDLIERITEGEIITLAKTREKEVIKSNIFKGTIKYLKWSGTKNHPKATECSLENVIIEKRGCFYYVTDDNGKELLKKKIDSNGTYVINYEEEKAEEKVAKEKEKYIRDNSSKEALEFYDSIKSNCQYSSSNHIYQQGRKPSKWDYEMGLDNFFKNGEHRLQQDFFTGILKLETWNGIDWIRE